MLGSEAEWEPEEELGGGPCTQWVQRVQALMGNDEAGVVGVQKRGVGWEPGLAGP